MTEALEEWNVCSGTQRSDEQTEFYLSVMHSGSPFKNLTTEERNEAHLDGLNQANRALLDVKYGKASFGTMREDEEMECERFVLAVRSHCGEETDVFYVPTGVVHAASAQGKESSLSISFGLQTQGLTWAHFMVHLLGASECLAPMCGNARKQLESVLIGNKFGRPVWGEVPHIAGACTTGLSAPYSPDLSRDSCSFFRSAVLERSRELTILWIELNITSRLLTVANESDIDEKEIHAAVDILLRNMTSGSALSKAFESFTKKTNDLIRRHRALGNITQSMHMGRRLLQSVSIDDAGVASVDQCSSSCDESCGNDCDWRNSGACGCDGSCNLGFRGGGGCDSSCECDCCPIFQGCGGCNTSCDASCSIFTCRAGFENIGTHCKKCEAGKFADGAGASACVNCSAGTFADGAGASACLNCPSGTYLETIGNDNLSDCIACAAGKYSLINGSSSVTTCLDCGSGKYLETESNNALCTDCVAGKYGVATGQTAEASCTTCGAGKYGVATGQTAEASCAACGLGKYGTATGQTAEASCAACGAGKYGAGTGQTVEASCTTCGAGKYGVAIEQSAEASCVACGTGKYGLKTGGSAEKSCAACVAGKYGVEIGGSSCTACGAGKYGVETGSSSEESCTDCGAGKYGVATGQTAEASCTACGAGKYGVVTGGSVEGSCAACGAGKYRVETGGSAEGSCTGCTSFSTTPTGSSALSSCSCNAGYGGNAGTPGGTCTACDTGTYVSGNVACTVRMDVSAGVGAGAAAVLLICILALARYYSFRCRQSTPTSERLPCIEGFFCKIQPNREMLLSTIESVRAADDSDKEVKLKELEALVDVTVEDIDPLKEAQELKTRLNHRRVFEVSIHPQPTFQSFSKCMRNASERNVRILHLSGHCKSHWGFFWLKKDAKEYENIPTERFIALFETEVYGGAHRRGTIECVVLNACFTEDLGKKLRVPGRLLACRQTHGP